MKALNAPKPRLELLDRRRVKRVEALSALVSPPSARAAGEIPMDMVAYTRLVVAAFALTPAVPGLLLSLLLLVLLLQASSSVTFEGTRVRDRGGGGRDGAERKPPSQTLPLEGGGTRGSCLPTAAPLLLLTLVIVPLGPNDVVVETRVAFTVVRSTD